MDTSSELKPLDARLEKLRLNKMSGYNYRERRQEDWDENYTLARDRIKINRLTQRQSVNVPLMQTVLRTTIKDIDDMPIVSFQNLDNDKQKEIFQNEYWKWTLEQNNAELQDIVDKKQDFFFGRTFDQWQIADGRIKFDIIDPEDILVDRYCDPTNLDSSRFLIHTHIFRPFSTIEANPLYNKKVVEQLKRYCATEAGLKKSADNVKMLTEKNNKMRDMGLTDVDSPVLGEAIVELSLHFVYEKGDKDTEEQLYYYVEADDQVILLRARLEEYIGVTRDNYWRNHFPYNSWADDVEKQDFWSSSIADIVRTPNKILNSWFSQMVENRTLRNFGMHYFDSSMEGFTPPTVTPQPWGWYGLPVPQNKKIDDIMKKIEIPDLGGDSLDDMAYVTQMIEKATGATSTQQGVESQREITLGEVKLALNEAKERVKGMSKFYTHVWKQRAHKFLKLIEAGSDRLDAVVIFKKGLNTDNIYTREIAPQDWMTPLGYTTRVVSQDEKNEEDTNKIERLNVAKQNMADNPVVDRIYKSKLLEFTGAFEPDDITEAMQYEEGKREMLMNPPIDPVTGMPVPPQVPNTVPQVPASPVKPTV